MVTLPAKETISSSSFYKHTVANQRKAKKQFFRYLFNNSFLFIFNQKCANCSFKYWLFDHVFSY